MTQPPERPGTCPSCGSPRITDVDAKLCIWVCDQCGLVLTQPPETMPGPVPRCLLGNEIPPGEPLCAVGWFGRVVLPSGVCLACDRYWPWPPGQASRGIMQAHPPDWSRFTGPIDLADLLGFDDPEP